MVAGSKRRSTESSAEACLSAAKAIADEDGRKRGKNKKVEQKLNTSRHEGDDDEADFVFSGYEMFDYKAVPAMIDHCHKHVTEMIERQTKNPVKPIKDVSFIRGLSGQLMGMDPNKEKPKISDFVKHISSVIAGPASLFKQGSLDLLYDLIEALTQIAKEAN